jgi:copper oxidase (laccase) domain-containing protein
VLFADSEAGVVGAAHAGWRGAFTGVLNATVDAMEACGASRARIVAVLGPTIRQPNYEVGPEFVARFEAADADNLRFFKPSLRAGHAMFDLPGFIVARLGEAGIGRIEDVGC